MRALEERLRINLSTEVRSIRRLDGGVELRLAGDELRRFDGVVVATHADQALRLLEDPSEDERRLLGVFGTTENDTVLHTDERFLPRRVATRGSWNYQLRDCGCDDGRPTMTYYLNKLQRLDEDEHYCVTLNRTAEIDPARIIRRFSYRHPLVTLESMRAQPELPRLNGPRRTAFAGAWQGYCFHEDGLRSGLAAAAAFGATAGEVGALHRHRDARAEDAEGERLPLPRLLLPARPRRAARARPARAPVRLEPARPWSASTTATTWTCAPTWPSTGSRPTGSCS